MTRCLRERTAIAALLCAVAALAAAADKPSPAPEGVSLVATPQAVEDFTLTNQDGKPLRFSQLRGQPALVFFGYAHCPDVCPAALAQLRALERAAPQEMANVHVVFVSIDGERDTPQALKRYLAVFSPRYIGLTGPSATVSKIAAHFPAVFFKGIPAEAGGDYPIQHTSEIYAIDAQGRLFARFSGASVNGMRATLFKPAQ